MGDTAVDIFQETLKELITSSKLSLIVEEKQQLQSLEEEIKYLRGFLKVTEKKRNDHSEVMNLVKQIRELVAEAENIVELFVAHAFKADYPLRKYHAFKADHAPYPLRKYQDHLSLDLETVKKAMKNLTAEVKKIYDKNIYDINGVAVKQLKHYSTGIGEGSGSSRGSNTSKVIKEKVVVGFEEEVNRLIDKLDDKGEGRPLEIISIIGAGGSGKTTLARKAYDHPFTSYAFEIRAWIDVSQDYDTTRKRDLLIHILESITRRNFENSSNDKLGEENSSNDKLGEHILKCLKGKKYLIVMDDIWGIEAWNDIQRSFPKECKGSKVLFTSWLLVQLDSVGYFPYYLAPLPKKWCWELLQKKLVNIGEQIAEKCKGLRLAVVTIAGILATEDKTLNVWENVAKHLSSIIAKNQEGCMEILELSYNHLPLHLKACFLYIGGYPEDNEIPIRELIWLWIAEGFIQQSEGEKSLETIAEGYLIDLTNRSLVQVAGISSLGVTKTCRIHDLLRELCLKKAEDDNFLVKVDEYDSFSPSATNKHRRLLIGDKFFQKLSLMPRNLRSFLCLRLQEKYYPRFGKKFPFFVENFELLRVLHFLSIACNGEIGIGHLVQLRYLAIAYESYRFHALPFSYLLNLETLNMRDLRGSVDIKLPHHIFKMVKLRHLYTKYGVFTFHHSYEETGGNDFERSSTLDNLQTFHKICACEACRCFLLRTPNIRKLGLHVERIPNDMVLRFPDLEFLKCLEKLTFTANLLDSSVGRTLPLGLKLPLTITRITLKFSRLKWEELSLLQNLPKLEVLRLLLFACVGPVWNASEIEGFPQLKYLKFNILDIEEWNASEDQFPKLEVLVIERCHELKQIPIAFGNLNELREIKLVDCGSSAEKLVVCLCWTSLNASEIEGFPQLKYLKFNILDIEEWNASEDQFPKLEVLVIERCHELKQILIAFGNLNELREIKLVDCGSSAEKLAREIQEEQRNRNGKDDCLNLIAVCNW